MLFEENPERSYDAEQINRWLEERGVPRNAEDPVNSVRGALSRLKQRGVIVNVRRGVFRLRQDEPDRDPWPFSDPAPAAEEGDEPPF
ncbi:MAG TPA: hypothetical protein VFI46_18040 [Jiangellaceae bacterium]|nr:hypothetical protein [Jiangellaceae bacterium]